MKPALALAVLLFAASACFAASLDLSETELLQLRESETSRDASLLVVSQIVGGCNNMTCCNGHRCPHEGGVCCADNHSCCPVGFICLPPPPPTACHPERMCGVTRCGLAPTPDCGCQGKFNCQCNPHKRKSKGEAVVHIVENITKAITGPVTDDDVIDVVSFVSADEVARSMIEQPTQAPPVATGTGKLRVIPLIVALPTPPQEPLSSDDILKAREDQQKKDEYDLVAEQHKQAVRAEEFTKQIKIKDDEAATKALLIRIGKEREAATQHEQLTQLHSENTYQQSAQLKSDLATVAQLGQQITKQEQLRQIAMASELVHVVPDDGSNNDAAKVLKAHKLHKQARRHEELDNILEEIRELKRDMQVMKAMKKNKENHDRIHMIKSVAADAHDLADRVKALRMNPPSLQWEQEELKELREMSYSKQQKQERDNLGNEIADAKVKLLKAEAAYNMTKDHLVAMAQAKK